MNYYENLFILDPHLDEKAAENALERLKDLIAKQGGEILKIEKWGRKRLAYVLKKRKEGNYVLLLFKAPPLNISELERSYKLLDFLVKFLIIKLNKKQIESALTKLSGETETEDKKTVPSIKEGSQNV
jgi:small subunit ribosomal protein S6